MSKPIDHSKKLTKERVGNSPRKRDGIEDKPPVFEFVLDHDGRGHGQSGAFARQEPDHRHVVNLGSDAGVDVETLEQRIDPGSDATVDGRQDKRLAGEQDLKTRRRGQSYRESR